MKIIIPARVGSKGFPGKNRLLLSHTEKLIKELGKYSVCNCDVVLSTDDNTIIDRAGKADFPCTAIYRPAHLANDYASMKDVLLDVKEKCSIADEELFLVLYLTYPNRTAEDVLKAMQMINNSGARSLLCKEEIKDHPYLCMYERQCFRGEQIVRHDLYRRQDYPYCFKISHYIIMMKAGEIKFLNHNLYNQDTIFMPIENSIDVDTERDYEDFLRKMTTTESKPVASDIVKIL